MADDPYAARRLAEILAQREEELEEPAPQLPPPAPPPEVVVQDLDRPPQHRTATAIAACLLCDTDGYTPAMQVCDHIDHAASAARGMSEIRSILKKGHQR